MFKIDIPGLGRLEAKYLILDLNGTIARDGLLIKGTKERLRQLATLFDKIYVLTADTQGTANTLLNEGIPVTVYKLTLESGMTEKQQFNKKLGPDFCIAVGNGVNDSLMLREAALGICILGTEGLATNALLNADIVVKDINDALDLFLKPKRLIATLRK